VSKVTIVEIHRQYVGIEVTQSPNVVITTIGVEIVVAPITNVVRSGVLIGFTTNLGSGLGGISIQRYLSRSSALPTTIITVVGTPHMVFTNSIMTTDVNKTTNQPSMNSMVVGGYKSRCSKSKRRILRTIYCNCIIFLSQRWPFCSAK
jgi:hypothetical protein